MTVTGLADIFRGGAIQRRILLWVIGISTLVAVLIGTGSYLLMARQLFANQRVLLHATAISAARDAGYLLESLTGDLQQVASSEAVEMYRKSYRVSLLQQELSTYQNSFPCFTYIPPDSGEVVQVLRGKWDFVPFDPSRHPAYARALEQPNQIIISAPYFSEALGEKGIDFFLGQVSFFGTHLGVLRGTVPASRFLPQMVDFFATLDGEIHILDERDLIVQHSHAGDEELGADYFRKMEADQRLKRELEGGESVFGEYPLGGRTMFIAAETLPVHGWKVIVSLAEESFLAPLTALRNLVLLISSLVILLASAAAYGIGRSIAAPIVALTSLTARIAQGGELAERVAVNSEDEVGQLARAFNRMLDHLAEAQSALGTKNQELQRSNAELDQFAYVVSHDLKAPLRAIANLSQWIEEDAGEGLDAENRRQMELLRGRVHRMEDLINGILEYSRIGRIAVPPEEVEVGALLAEVVDSLAIPPHFSISIGEGMPCLSAPRVRLGQVFANLISNAVKYNDKAEGRVNVSAEDQGDVYLFAVADNGPGVAPRFHERIFQIFQTLQARDSFESTGVGLTLVKKIVEEQGGEVWIDSEEGKGATFRFTWPKTPSKGKTA